MSYQPTGMITALVTPFDANDELDKPALRRISSWQKAAGVDALMIIGGSGEYVSLSPDERRMVIDVVLDEVRSDLPVIVGILSPATGEAIKMARYCEGAGASALLVLPPYYIRPSQDGVYTHYASIAARVHLPIIVYNNPGRVGLNLDADLLERLGDIEGVVGLKECERDLGRVAEKIYLLGDRLSILSGEDDLAFPSLLLGAKGGIFTVANVVPQLFVRLYKAVQGGDIASAQRLHFQLLPLIRSLYTVNHPGPVKEAMAMIGQPVGRARLPLQTMSNSQAREVEDRLRPLVDSLSRTSTECSMKSCSDGRQE